MGFQYEVGKIYEEHVKPVCGERGFHFCTKAVDCFNYYGFMAENKVAEVVALGDVDKSREDTKCCTNKIQILREITWQEILTIVNTGKYCTGMCNSGSRNSGNWNAGGNNSGSWNAGSNNSGCCNSGSCNSGSWNSGNNNSGSRNSGSWNAGDNNSGSWNSGNWNTGRNNSGSWNAGDCNEGDANTGDWNKSSYNTGCFMSKENQTIMFFNKPSKWTYNDWLCSEARGLLYTMPKNVVEWILPHEMTNEEKANHPDYETTHGYLKVLTKTESSQLWWDSISDADKETIKGIPNFDAKIFEEITGIKI